MIDIIGQGNYTRSLEIILSHPPQVLHSVSTSLTSMHENLK
jgi:hypothetical protein